MLGCIRINNSLLLQFSNTYTKQAYLIYEDEKILIKGEIMKLLKHLLRYPIKYTIGFIILIGIFIFIGKISGGSKSMNANDITEANHMKYIVHVVHMNSTEKVIYEHECESYERTNGKFIMYDRDGVVVRSENDDPAHQITIYPFDDAPRND